MKKFIIGVLAVLGVLFIVIMVWPEDDTEETTGSVISVAVSETVSTETSASTAEPTVEVAEIGTDAKSATIMIYMNGSDLETDAGEATADISEMLASGIGENVKVVIQTMGTKKWQNYGISAKTSQRYAIKGGKLTLVQDSLGQLNCGAAETMSDFIDFSKRSYPAERYIFLFWNHGGGPVYGFGYDDNSQSEDSLTLDEMVSAFSEHRDISFDLIGMDCCIMANLETCSALAPFCRYTVLSEDFESGLGWSYTKWMKTFEENPGISTPVLGKQIIDTMVAANETEEGGDTSTMVLVDEAAVSELFPAWINYAYANSEKLLDKNYSRKHKAKGRGFISSMIDSWLYDDSDVTLSDYYISDVLAMVENIGVDDDIAGALKQSLKKAVVYFGHTSDKNELTGLAVSLPYGDSDYYRQLYDVYTRCGFDSNYIAWLENFVSAVGYESYYDYDDFENSWDGWSSYGSGWQDEGDYYGYDDGDYAEEDWVYDYEEQIWYMYEGDNVYLYDDEENVMYFYDTEADIMYYYDDVTEEWYETED